MDNKLADEYQKSIDTIDYRKCGSIAECEHRKGRMCGLYENTVCIDVARKEAMDYVKKIIKGWH